MTWIAPDVSRTDPPPTSDERTSLDAWLDYHRQTLLGKCAGLTGEQLAERAVPPSSLSLLGLVRHMAEVELSWFRHRLEGEDVTPLYYSETNPDGDFDDVDPALAERDFAVFAEQVERARAIAAARSLDETFFHSHRATRMDLRWLYTHMIEEYARHNGHADLLRERIDGATGD
jgi:hypothetical protein